VADAIRDCSRRGALVLDGFSGSGTTLIAAETCGRIGRLIEHDPIYCDTIVRRWQAVTGQRATLAGAGHSFEDVCDQRLGGVVNGDPRPDIEPVLLKATRHRRSARRSALTEAGERP